MHTNTPMMVRAGNLIAQASRNGTCENLILWVRKQQDAHLRRLDSSRNQGVAEQTTQHLNLRAHRKRRANRRTTGPGAQVLGKSPTVAIRGMPRRLQHHHRRTFSRTSARTAALCYLKRAKADLTKFFGTSRKGGRKASCADPISRPAHSFLSADFVLTKGL